MKFMQQYLLFRKQKKAARKNMKQKQDAITRKGVGIVNEEKICLKEFPVLSVVGEGVDIEVDRCEAFYKTEYCSCEDCPMFQKNHEFIDAVKAYQSIKTAQRDFAKTALFRHK